MRLDVDQIGRLYDVFIIEDNETIEDAYFENKQLHIIIIKINEDTGSIYERIDYEPNLDLRLREDYDKLFYIMFNVKGEKYGK